MNQILRNNEIFLGIDKDTLRDSNFRLIELLIAEWKLEILRENNSVMKLNSRTLLAKNLTRSEFRYFGIWIKSEKINHIRVMSKTFILHIKNAEKLLTKGYKT